MLDIILKDFTLISDNIVRVLIPISKRLLYFMTAFQIIRVCLDDMQEFPFLKLLKIIINYFLYRYLIENYKTLLINLKNTILIIGNKFFENNQNVLITPDLVYKNGYASIEPLKDLYLNQWSIAIILIMLIAISVFLIHLEFLLVTSLVILLIPFFIFDITKYLGAKFFEILGEILFRFIVYMFLLNVFMKYIKKTPINTVEDAYIFLLKLLAICLALWLLPFSIGKFKYIIPREKFKDRRTNA